MNSDLLRRLGAEFIGSAILLSAIVGSGIMADRLSGGSVAVALLANAIATGAALAALILTFIHVSGAHFNPAVTLSATINGAIRWKDALSYFAAQIAGGLCGVAVANVMFDLPVFFASTKLRTGPSQFFGEFIATFGLIIVIGGCSRLQNTMAIPLAVASYITAAIWFTSSTSFANPAVTIARTLSDTFTGIRPIDAPAFIAAQIFGAVVAAIILKWLIPREKV